MDGYKTLKASQPVQFDIIQGPKGLHAINIQCPAEQASKKQLENEDVSAETAMNH